MKINKGIRLAIEKAGSQEKLAKLLKCNQPLISYYLSNNPVPAKRALMIEEKTGVHRSLIRPDLWAKQ